MSKARATRAGQTAGPGAGTLAPSDHEAITKAARGVPDRTASTLSFDAGTRTFTITPVSGAWSYYIAGRRYIKSKAESIVIPDTSGPHWIYYDGTTLSSAVNAGHEAVDDLIVNKARIGIVYWNATDGAGHLVADERHGTEMPGATQEWFHDTTGAVWEDGLALSGYTLDTDTDAGIDFQVTDGLIRDEDLELSIVDGAPATQYAQLLNSANAEVPIAYRDDVDGTWTQDAATTLPYKRFGAGRLAYNHDDLDGTFSQVEVTNNRFVLATLVATNDWQYPIKMVQGQAEYIDKKTAIEDANAEQVAWGTMLTPEIVPLYRLVMETGDGLGGTNKCKIVAVFDLRRLSISGGLSSPAEPHPMLSNTHSDSVANAVTQGGLQVGNATPAWDLLTVGAAATYFRSDGTDASWTALAIVDDPSPECSADLNMAGNDIVAPSFVRDVFGIAQLGFGFVMAAVNNISLTNAATGVGPTLYATGSDANVDLNLASKGTGLVKSLDSFDVTGNITVSGTVDGVDIAGTVVTAAAALTNLRIVRGDVAARAVKTTGIAISDANEVSGMSQLSMTGPIDGVTQLDVDDLRFDGITISVTLADGWLRLVPNGTGRVYISIAGVAQFNQDAITLANAAWHANMIDTRTSYSFTHAISGAAQAESAAITVGTETNWSAVVGTQDAYMAFQTALNGAVTEKVRINSLGVVGINTTDPGSNIATDLFDVRQDQERASTGTYTYHNTVAGKGSSFYGGRARGEWDDPDIVNNADTLFAFVALGYDGAAWKAAAQIIFTVDGAPGLNAIPTQIAFRTGPTAPTIADRFTIQSDGDILVDSGTSVFIRDPALGFNSSVDGQFDVFADAEIELTAPIVDLTASLVYVRSNGGIDYAPPGGDVDVDLITVSVTGIPIQKWDESEDAFAMTHRLYLPEGVRTKYAVDDVSDPPTDAELDAAFGDPEDVGTGFVGILDDGGAGLYCYICWTTGTNGEWFYVAGTKAV